MYFFTRDTLGRTFHNAVDGYIVKEIFDANEIHILQLKGSFGPLSGWILLFGGTQDEITQRFDEIITKANFAATQKQIPIIDFNS